jgi:hypothetical protein
LVKKAMELVHDFCTQVRRETLGKSVDLAGSPFAAAICDEFAQLTFDVDRRRSLVELHGRDQWPERPTGSVLL